MDLMEGIYSRRSVRSYTNEEPTRDQVLEIVKAGSWAPRGSTTNRGGLLSSGAWK
ncbi:nitroreductase family protein [Geotalea toluenoxydans]|uniref:nitroreductase family protein n=1 Tax=Geotalea toluenoxydans TaxID=421624 RepID=UPI000B05D693|nr:nitroreductase family protein [Geotalea toluenoxydans]